MSFQDSFSLRKISGEDGCYPIDSTAGTVVASTLINNSFPAAKRITGILALTDAAFSTLEEEATNVISKYLGGTTDNTLKQGGILTSQTGFSSVALSSGDVLLILSNV